MQHKVLEHLEEMNIEKNSGKTGFSFCVHVIVIFIRFPIENAVDVYQLYAYIKHRKQGLVYNIC